MSNVELILQTPGEDRRIALDDGLPCRIGRDARNTLVLDSDMVSRHHAMVQHNEFGGYSLYDLGSRNGTFLNGRRLMAPVELHQGDSISIGDFELVFTRPAEGGARSGGGMLDGEATIAHVAVRNVLVLVMDICGFTTLSQEIGATRIAEVMGTFNSECSAILRECGTWELKYIGDAVMAVWTRAPQMSSLSVLRSALSAASSIYVMVGSFQERFDLPFPIRVGAGLNSGLAMVGNLGTAVVPDYTALGDVVNRAFRLESSTRHLSGDLAFGEEIRHIVAEATDIADVAQPNTVQLKGYAETCQVYSMSLSNVPHLLECIDRQLRGGAAQSSE